MDLELIFLLELELQLELKMDHLANTMFKQDTTSRRLGNKKLLLHKMHSNMSDVMFDRQGLQKTSTDTFESIVFSCRQNGLLD